MAQVATTTIADALAPPTTPAVARDHTNGRLYVLVRTGTDTLTLYRSTDSGGSWASYAAFTHTGMQEWGSLVVDRHGWAHLAYRIGASSTDTIWYRRCNLSTAAWSSGLQCSGTDANGGVNGSIIQGVDLAVVRNPNGSYAIAVAGAYTRASVPSYGLWVVGVSITSSGTVYSNNGIILNNRAWFTVGATAGGRMGVTCEVEHTGDGFTSATPHLWVSWGRATLRMVKLAWQGSSVGWSGPSNHQIIRATVPALDYAAGRWDGQQWLMGVISPDDSTVVRIYQRNQANTATTTFDTPVHPQGVIRNLAVSYEEKTRNIRVLAIGTSTAVLYYVDYVRATSTWTAWATVTATAVLGNTEWSVRRGGSAGNARHDVITGVSGAPNTIQHTALSASSVPNIATWDTAAQPYLSGGAANVNAALTLDWVFADPDPGQTQGSYAVSRQIGAGTIQYWRASDSTWQVAEVQNASATSALTLAASWGADSDAAHAYKVKVWDSAGVPAVAYSTALTLVPSVPVNPAFTAPAAGGTIATDTVTVSWTAAQQTAYRIVLATTGGAQTVHDTGKVISSDTSLVVPYTLATGTSWQVTLYTYNTEGLISTGQTRSFSVVYSPPPAIASTLTPLPAQGIIRITPIVTAPVGTQPAIITRELWRRPSATPVLNANPSMAGNVTGWTVGGGGTGALTYSTAQSAPPSGPGSARYVPNGATTAPTIESTPVTIDPTRVHCASGWVRPDTAAKPIFLQINWYTAANVYIASVTTVVSAPVAGAWHYLFVTANPLGVTNAAKASAAIGASSTPAAGDAFYADMVRLELMDATPGVRIAVDPAGAVDDWGPSSGIDYEYRWVVRGANGTSINSPWTD